MLLDLAQPLSNLNLHDVKNSLTIGVLFLLLIGSSALTAQQSHNNQRVSFYSDSYDNFLREARKQDKIAILDFWASWCAPCKKMEEETFNDPEFAAYMNQNFIVYKVNVDTFDGMEIANRFGVESFPTIIKLNSRGKFEAEWKGFFPANYLKNILINSSEKSSSYELSQSE